MATITVRNLDETVKTRLRIRAAAHDRSMEEEVRVILHDALAADSDSGGLGTLIHEMFARAGGVDLPAPDRSEPPRLPDLAE